MALIHCDFHSATLGLASTMTVILPQKPVSKGEERPRFPVLYLLHGMSDDHSIWARRTSIERYVANLNLAVVMPAVHRSYYTDMAEGGAYWTFISEELPSIVKGLLPISDKREETFVAGLSMGGYGAFKLALRKPEVFAAAASMSGALGVGGHFKAAGAGDSPEVRRIFGDPSKISGSENDLFALSEKLAESGQPLPQLFQCCGTDDFLYQDNLAFKAHLEQLKWPFIYKEGPGTHEWGFWDKWIQDILAWLPLK